MKIVFHIGANFTDGDQLVKSLVKNAADLAPRGVAIPGLARYRRLIRETIQGLNGGDPAPDTRDVLLDAILDRAEVDRLVMSNSAFIGLPVRVFEEGQFYGLATMKVRALRQLFPGDDLELCFAVRNPATFVPAAFDAVDNRPFDAFMAGIDPMTLRWSEVIARIRAAAPSARLTVWCNEDTPLIWGEVLRRMTGVASGTALNGEHDIAASIMSKEGMTRFRSYLSSHPPQSEIQHRRIIAAFLDKYALEDEIEEVVDLPGWDEALVDALTRTYEADVATIADMDGVEFIAP